jgi:predicted N-acetyltransferase YhbS
MSPSLEPNVVIRQAKPEDTAECGRICYDAFSTINANHGFPVDFPAPEHAVGVITAMFSSPGHYCVVAEVNGRLVGSNCIDERSAIAGIGPITVDPSTQNARVGRKLMDALIERAHSRGTAGIRLVQAAFHNRSLSLYTNLGFDVREPLSCMQGRCRDANTPGCVVRPAEAADVEACNELSRRVHGFDRGGELPHAIQEGSARVVERGGRITGYTTALAFFGHGVAETNMDLQALLASAESFGGPGILIPSRNAALFRWCLTSGLRVVQPMTLMSMGLYNEPAGAWFPSILF